MTHISTSHDPTREVVVRMALLNVARRLDIKQRQLGKMIGVSESRMSRIYNEQSFLAQNSKEYELALLLIRAFRSLDAILGGNEENTCIWFHSFNDRLGGVPAQLSEKITGLNDVVRYLDAMRGKL